ncbi:MAG: Txe/YoeB family addiction module toxin [Prevotellaceae bacterium]|jgi:toxin YoeB|nr:Txe/YoeB family addiction module toxin [Prevotellaceae bacterium]
MIYNIDFTPQAKDDIALLKKSEPNAFKKLEKLLIEMREHPTSGTGNPEKLKYDFAGYYSRRISNRHRIIYAIFEASIRILVVSAYGHYNDR